jgi:hypothetical protein
MVINFKCSKKGQVKTQQMAFMLIALTIFFVLVGLVVFIFTFSNVGDAATELREKNAMLLASKLANSPEFACGDSYGNNKLACVDFDKLMALKENINRYDKFWGVANIEVRKIYPSGDTICTKGNYPNCEIIRLRDKEVSGFDSTNFVSLCHKKGIEGDFYDKCELAKLIISYEVAQ